MGNLERNKPVNCNHLAAVFPWATPFRSKPLLLCATINSNLEYLNIIETLKILESSASLWRLCRGESPRQGSAHRGFESPFRCLCPAPRAQCSKSKRKGGSSVRLSSIGEPMWAKAALRERRWLRRPSYLLWIPKVVLSWRMENAETKRVLAERGSPREGSAERCRSHCGTDSHSSQFGRLAPKWTLAKSKFFYSFGRIILSSNLTFTV